MASKVRAMDGDGDEIAMSDMGQPTNEETVALDMERKEGNSDYPNGHLNREDDSHDIVLQEREFNPADHNACAQGVMRLQGKVIKFFKKHKKLVIKLIQIILLLGFCAYFIYAMYYRFGDEGSIRLLWCTILGVLLLLLHFQGDRLSPITGRIRNFLNNANFERNRRIIRWVLYIVSTVITVILLIVLVAIDTPRNLLSLLGLAAFIFICFITSFNPAMIDWHPVFWGFSLQFYFAILILKTRWGYETFKWLGDRVTAFLAFSDAGATFVFGDAATIYPTDPDRTMDQINFLGVHSLHFFAFRVMPMITFFSTFIAVMYYLGVMQKIIRVIGYFLAFCLGTTPAESINAAGNIFVAMHESPLMIRPFIPRMTRSELHAVMTGGFATIAGSVLGAYIGFGVPADHLLSASVMSAPAALAISKLTYPEIDIPIVTREDYDNIKTTKAGNIIEAACNGAMTSAKIIASVLVNVIAFLSLLKFVNATLTWFGDRVGVDNLTFELICSYVLYPVALCMGAEPDDCRQIAELVGIKTFTNEFIAYRSLSDLLKNRVVYKSYVETFGADTVIHDGGDLILTQQNSTRLVKGIISPRSEVIATYALCGFSNFGSMGILLGSLSALAPRRRPTMAKLVLRAMIAGNIACFFTACIAGLFYEEFV